MALIRIFPDGLRRFLGNPQFCRASRRGFFFFKADARGWVISEGTCRFDGEGRKRGFLCPGGGRNFLSRLSFSLSNLAGLGMPVHILKYGSRAVSKSEWHQKNEGQEDGANFQLAYFGEPRIDVKPEHEKQSPVPDAVKLIKNQPFPQRCDRRTDDFCYG